MVATSPTDFSTLLNDTGKRNRDRRIIELLVDSLYSPVTSEVTDTSYDVVASDSGTTIRGENASAQTFTANNSDFSVGDSFRVKQIGAGRITGAITGASLVSPNGTQTTRNEGSELLFYKASSTSWECTGDELVPSFRTHLGTTEGTNTVGADDTVYTILFDDEQHDHGGVVSATGVFTAPVTGAYSFCAQAFLSGLTAAADRGLLTLKPSTGIPATSVWGDTDDMPTTYGPQVSGVFSMTAGDTMVVTIEVEGEAGNVVDIIKSPTNGITYFCGHLVT